MLGVRNAILQRLADARRETDKLFDILRPGAIYERPIPERHRIVFYLGHLETFDWNLLRDRLLGALGVALPEAPACLVHAEFATPHSFARYTRRNAGAVGGPPVARRNA